MRVLDAPIIDYVFQPVSDWLARWITCFRIAIFLTDGAILVFLYQMASLYRAVARYNLWRQTGVTYAIPLFTMVVIILIGMRILFAYLERCSRGGRFNVIEQNPHSNEDDDDHRE